MKPSHKALKKRLYEAVKQIKAHGLENEPPKDIYHVDYGWVLKDGKQGPNFDQFLNSINKRNEESDDQN